MRRALKIAGRVLLVAILAAFAWFVWPTPWAYYEGGPAHLIRRHRLSGEIQWFLSTGSSSGGWRDVGR